MTHSPLQTLGDLTARLRAGLGLSGPDLRRAVDALLQDGVELVPKADFLLALRDKGETAEEIAGFANALLLHAVDPGIRPEDVPGPLMDVCGTGGDRMDAFNISTTVMFVLAAGGVAVVKHGNRAITSKCGGADVLESLGIDIELPPERLRECVARHGLGFLFAPAYHPAFKTIAPVRKALAARGIPTIFNLLGPLLNPARPARQLIGLFTLEGLPRYAEVLRLLGRERAWAVHGAGMDELSLSGKNQVAELVGNQVRNFSFDAVEYDFPSAAVEELQGGGREENAAILESILSGDTRGAKRDIVVLNAGAAFFIAGVARDLASGFGLAVEAIESGRAREKLHALRQFCAKA